MSIKICKVISCFGHGRGGHFYDLAHVAAGLRDLGFQIQILNIGTNPSPVVETVSPEIRRSFILYQRRKFKKYIREISKFISENKSAIFHCYDIESFAIISLFIPSKKIRLSKCGGAPPSKFYPYVSNQIVMSYDDVDWFTNRNQKVQFIPNRIHRNLLINTLRNFHSNREIHQQKKFLRIIRITEYYRDSIMSYVNVARSMANHDIAFILIGKIESETLKKKLLSIQKKLSNFYLFTDDHHTINAQEFIGDFDIIYGTGRGVMEAIVLGKKVVTYCKGVDNPIPLTEELAIKFLKSNYSERNMINEDYQLIPLQEFMTTKKVVNYEKVSQLFFEVQGAKVKFENFYRKKEKNQIPLIYRLLNKLITVRFIHNLLWRF